MKHLIWVLAVAFVFVPLTISAQESNMYMNKFVTGPTDDGVYTLTLESYAKGEKTKIETHKPTDIVLVLDVSGSMDEYIPSTSSVWNAKNQGFTYYDIKNASYDYCYLYNGTYYKVKADDESWALDPECYLYFTVNDVKYYLKGSGGPSTTKPSYVGSRFSSIWTGTLYWSETEVEKIEALQIAVNKFIDDVYADTQKDYDKDGKPDNIDHKISIIKFAEDAYCDVNGNTISNPDLHEGNHNVYGEPNYTEVVKNLKSVSTAASELKTAVSGLTTGDATAADYGMTLAKMVLEATKTGGKYPDRQRLVIFFTDGDPNHGSGFSTTVANSTISLSKTLKSASTDLSTMGAKVFAIGTFSDPDTDEKTYMNYISSNYPNASSMTEPGGSKESDKFYSNVYSDTALKNVFETIVKEIGGTEVTLDATAQVIDIITSDFTLPEGAVAKDIKVKTAAYNTSTGKFADPVAYSAATVALTGKNGIKVSNFDFSAHWCGPGATSGQKLIIEIPIIESATNKGGLNIPTNTTDSGIYEEDAEEPFFKYTPPVVSIPILKIVKKGMRTGESAVFTIIENPGSSSAKTSTITLTGKTGSDVTALINVKDKTTYSVQETGWSWTYTPDTTTAQSVTFNGDAQKTVTFTNTGKDITVKHSEAVVKNNFKTKTHTTSKTVTK